MKVKFYVKEKILNASSMWFETLPLVWKTRHKRITKNYVYIFFLSYFVYIFFRALSSKPLRRINNGKRIVSSCNSAIFINVRRVKSMRSRSTSDESTRWARANDMPCNPCKLCHELIPRGMGRGRGGRVPCHGAIEWFFWMRLMTMMRVMVIFIGCRY